MIYNDNMNTTSTPTRKFRVQIIANGRYRCVKVTCNIRQAADVAYGYRQLGYLTKVTAKEVR